MKTTFRNASLREHEAMRTVLARMADDQARAERITALKAERPDLTWEDIADRVGVKERSVHNWRSTGGMKYENAEKLAEVFGVSVDYIWRGGESPGETPDIMGSMNGEKSKFEERLAAVERDVAEILRLVRQRIGSVERDELEAEAGPPDEIAEKPSKPRAKPSRRGR
ncbi:MAG: helix-turn-helix domain-containing protein [Hyalangium sp.]|uniref:helix-turn-helix domain-containing protein n=1 Tax=Hyalangium sp. TaxID=2028555 RepID=UPI003899D774